MKIPLWDETATTAVDIDLDAQRIERLNAEADMYRECDRELTPTDKIRMTSIPEEIARLTPGVNVLTIHIKTLLNADRMKLALAIQECEQTEYGFEVLLGLAAEHIKNIDGQGEAIEQAGGIAFWILKIKNLAMQKAILDAVTDSCLIPGDAEKN